MDFISQIAREVFGKDVIIVRDKNPSYCVAKGLGWVAVADDRRGACIEDAKKQLMDAGKWKYGLLEEAVQKKIYGYIAPHIVKATTNWGNLSGKHSARELEEMISEEVSKATNTSEGGDLQKQVQGELEGWINQFVESATSAINNQAGKVFSERAAEGLLVDKKIFERLDGSSISFDMNLTSITEQLDLSSVINKVVQVVANVGITLAVVLAIMYFIPGVNLLAYIIGLLAGTVGQGMIADTDKDKLRDEKSRRKIAKQMPGMLGRQEVIDQINNVISDTLEPLKKQCEEAINEESVGNMVTAGIDMILLQPDSFRQHT